MNCFCLGPVEGFSERGLWLSLPLAVGDEFSFFLELNGEC
jgi:hypothetical protein